MTETIAAPRATESEVIALNESGVLCELIDGQIVRKVVGRSQAFLTILLGAEFVAYLKSNDIGHVCGPDFVIRFGEGKLYAPDLTFTNWDRCPSPAVPPESVGAIIPNLAVEILSPSNRAGEIPRKIGAYFAAGVELVWVIDPEARSGVAYTSPTTLSESDTLRGGSVLPGFELPLAALFARLL